MTAAVEFHDITKRFGAVTALEGVSFGVPLGTMCAVVGENGAGKSTLMRILYGASQPDSGWLDVFGKSCAFGSSAEAAAAGIGMVSQHDGIVPELSCLQNLVLGSEGGMVLRTRSMRERAEMLSEQMGYEFRWNSEARELSPSGRQKLEILKLLWRNARLMILDEPTAMLSPKDADSLFESLERLLQRGATVLLVTHRVQEVMRNCQRVAILRAGRLVGEMDVTATDERSLAEMIVGQAAPTDGRAGASPPLGGALLQLDGVSARGSQGNETLKKVFLTVREGETVGIAGVDGNGQQELVQIVTGLEQPIGGQMRLFESLDERSRVQERISAGLRVIPEDRHRDAVIEEWSLEENSILGLQRLRPICLGGRIDDGARASATAQVLARFHTQHGGVSQPMASLSGGNQQRLVVGRALQILPKLLVAFQPVRGLDLGATRAIYAAIHQACSEGMGALIISFDLDELLDQCDRVAVLYHGELLSPPPGRERDRATIGDLMVGAA